MKKIFYILFLLSITSFAQENPIQEMLEYGLQVRQFENTSETLKKYTSGIENQSDYLYLVLYRPMSCPRCEAAIHPFYKMLKQNSPKNKMILATVYEDEYSAQKYVERNNYKADAYLYDTKYRYKDIFDFNSGEMYGLYILKIDQSKGGLIIGGEPVVLNKQFVDDLVKYTEEFPLSVNHLSDDFSNTTPHVNPKKSDFTYTKIVLKGDQEHPISGIYGKTSLKDNYLTFTDELANAGYLFEINYQKQIAKFKNLIVADDVEKKMFIDVPEKVFKEKTEEGGIFYIACESDFIGDNRIGISYSLPKLFMRNEYTMAYFNEPVIISMDKKTLQKRNISSLDFDIFNDDFMYQHYNFFPLDENKIVVPCVRNTWPIEVDLEDYQGKENLDPFLDSFYKQKNPYLAVFDLNTGKLIERFGNLTNVQELSKTGYYFISTVLGSFNQEIIYGDGYSGKLFLSDTDNLNRVKKEYNLFNIDTNLFPETNAEQFYSLDHVKNYTPIFNKYIKEVRMTDQQIYCLVNNENSKGFSITENCEFIVLDKFSGNIISKKHITKESEEERILSISLANIAGKITPYYMGKTEKETFIKIIMDTD